MYEQAEQQVDYFNFNELTFLFCDMALIGKVSPNVHNRICEFIDDH